MTKLSSTCSLSSSLSTCFRALVLYTVMVPTISSAQTYTVLYAFKGSPDGNQPSSGVLRDSKGNLYGTTFSGGAQACKGFPGCGTVFIVDTANTERVLYNFTPGQGNYPPEPGLQLLNQSGVYGTTWGGGASNRGSVFQVSPTGQFNELFDFAGGSKGNAPSLFARDPAGNLYGTTRGGGNFTKSGFVFKLNAIGGGLSLYNFTCLYCDNQGGSGFGLPDQSISAGRIMYGVAEGGTYNSGVVYQFNSSGATVLYNFQGGTDGWSPQGPLLRDSAGNLYGTTGNPDGSFCDSDGCGNVFKVDPSGHETVLFTFMGGPEGGHPRGGLVRDAQGNIYGISFTGGQSPNYCGDPYDRGCGVIFKIDTTGRETVLHTFTNQADGGYPNGDLIIDSAGNLYGTTTTGGDPNCQCGVVFKLTP